MRHTLAIIAAQAIRALAPLATLPLLSRSTSLADFGEYVFYLTLGLAISVVVDFGFSFTGYGLASKADDQRSFFARTTATRLLVGVVLALVVIGIVLVVAPSSLPFAAAACAYAIGLGCTPLWFMNWRKQSGRLLLYESLPVVAMVAAALLVFFFHVPTPLVLLAGAAGALIGPLQLSIPSWIREPRETLQAIWPLLTTQANVTLGRVVVAAYTVAFIPIGSVVVHASAVGHYVAVEKLGSVLGIIGIMTAQWLAPALVRARTDGAGLKPLASRVFLLGIVLPAAVGIPLALAGGTLIAILFGPNFHGLDLGGAIVVGASILGFWSTIIWSGTALPLGITRGYLPTVALGAIVAILALLAFRDMDYLALSLARLAAETAAFIVSALLIAPRIVRFFRRQ